MPKFKKVTKHGTYLIEHRDNILATGRVATSHGGPRGDKNTVAKFKFKTLLDSFPARGTPCQGLQLGL